MFSISALIPRGGVLGLYTKSVFTALRLSNVLPNNVPFYILTGNL